MWNLQDCTPLGYNHYHITRQDAVLLSRGRLPREGYESLVRFVGQWFWLMRTPVNGAQVWCLHGPSSWGLLKGRLVLRRVL